jgi:LysM repeat protein
MSDRDDLYGAGRSRRSPARYLAPVLLIAVIAGTYVVVHNGINKINHASTTASSSRTTATRPHLTRAQRKYSRDKFYVVQPGDTLTVIASKTGVGIARLEALNRQINPNSLQLGQRIRLRR